MKKIVFLVLLGYLFFYAYEAYNNIYKYNANNPQSLELMLNIIPDNEKLKFLKAFQLASEDLEGKNLHGLTKDEIYFIANKKQKE